MSTPTFEDLRNFVDSVLSDDELSAIHNLEEIDNKEMITSLMTIIENTRASSKNTLLVPQQAYLTQHATITAPRNYEQEEKLEQTQYMFKYLKIDNVLAKCETSETIKFNPDRYNYYLNTMLSTYAKKRTFKQSRYVSKIIDLKNQELLTSLVYSFISINYFKNFDTTLNFITKLKINKEDNEIEGFELLSKYHAISFKFLVSDINELIEDRIHTSNSHKRTYDIDVSIYNREDVKLHGTTIRHMPTLENVSRQVNYKNALEKYEPLSGSNICANLDDLRKDITKVEKLLGLIVANKEYFENIFRTYYNENEIISLAIISKELIKIKPANSSRDHIDYMTKIFINLIELMEINKI